MLRENKMYQIDGGIGAVIANYTEEPDIIEYQNNPFIEALPPILSQHDVVEQLSVYPYYSENERNLPTKKRIHLTQRLYQYFQPLSLHFDLEERFSRTIRQGYLSRNPLSANYASSLKNGNKIIKNPSLGFNNFDFKSTAAGFTIIGVSGIGKTTSIDRVLSLYPQVIKHTEYKGTPLNLLQIPWLKLDCPYDGSIKALCINFFAKVDSLLGTSYSMKFTSGNNSTSTMLPRMAQVCTLHGIGVLIIDEVQHLSSSKSGGSEKMLNFFVTLVNTLGIPTILIGTMKALSSLQRQFRQARRGSGQGDMVLDRMVKEDNWDILIEGLWEYQWTKNPTPLTDELKDVIYEESQGIIDIAVKLYVMTQIIAMTSTKKELITPALIKKVAKENLKLVKPMLDALKTGNLDKISLYEDIKPVDITNFIQNQLSEAEKQSRIALLKGAKDLLKQPKDNIKDIAIAKLISLGVDGAEASSQIKSIKNVNSITDVNELVKIAYGKILMGESSTVEIKKPKPISKVSKESYKNNVYDNLLHFDIERGKTEGLDSYESLLNKGYIKKPLDELCI
ncbi:ATP-binding protein [Clostridium perfringens]